MCVLLTTKIINISGSEVTLNLKYIYLIIYTSIISPDLGIPRVLSFLIYPTSKIRDCSIKSHIEFSSLCFPPPTHRHNHLSTVHWQQSPQEVWFLFSYSLLSIYLRESPWSLKLITSFSCLRPSNISPEEMLWIRLASHVPDERPQGLHDEDFPRLFLLQWVSLMFLIFLSSQPPENALSISNSFLPSCSWSSYAVGLKHPSPFGACKLLNF